MPTTEITPQEVTTYLTTSELGIPKERSKSGRFMSTKGTYDEKGNYIASTTGNITRAENIISTQAETFNRISKGEKTQKAFETFDEYVARINDEYVAKINKGGKP
jgi:exosome complex RNA-binding protein Csl4